MNTNDPLQARLGYLYVALAAILFAISGTSAKFLFNDGITAFQLIQMRTTVLLYGLLFAALMWNILHPPLEAFLHRYSLVQWGWILFIGICGTILPFGLYVEGIKRIQPTHASITATLEPISAGVIAAVFLGEVMAPLQIIGGLIVIGSIITLQLNRADN